MTVCNSNSVLFSLHMNIGSVSHNVPILYILYINPLVHLDREKQNVARSLSSQEKKSYYKIPSSKKPTSEQSGPCDSRLLKRQAHYFVHLNAIVENASPFYPLRPVYIYVLVHELVVPGGPQNNRIIFRCYSVRVTVIPSTMPVWASSSWQSDGYLPSRWSHPVSGSSGWGSPHYYSCCSYYCSS